jgi:excisionase family DNA binding protein
MTPDPLSQMLTDAVIRGLTEMGFTPEALASKTPQTRVLSLEQAAEYMGMTRDSLKHNYDLGRIKAVRVDKKLRFDRIDLDAWIDANKRERG